VSARVVAALVLVRDYPVKQSRALSIADAVPKHEERRFDTTLSQDVQNRLGDARGRAVIERKGNFLHGPCSALSSGKSAGTYAVTLCTEPGYRHLDNVTLRQIRLRLHAEANARWRYSNNETSTETCHAMAVIDAI